MSQILLEAFNSIPYPTERTEKNGMMDISYTFEDETNHSFRFHFEKRVNYGRNVFVLTLGQKSPNIKMYKRVFGKFHNPLRVIATLIDIVKDNRQKRSDVKGLIIEVPEQAFGAHGRLVDKIIKRELRTELKVQDLELSIEEFEKMGLKGVVATVKPYQFDSVFNGKIMKEILDNRDKVLDAAIASSSPVEDNSEEDVVTINIEGVVPYIVIERDTRLMGKVTRACEEVFSGYERLESNGIRSNGPKMIVDFKPYTTEADISPYLKSLIKNLQGKGIKTELKGNRIKNVLETNRFKYELVTDDRYDIDLRFENEADAKKAYDVLSSKATLQYGNTSLRHYGKRISTLRANATGREMDRKVERVIQILGNPSTIASNLETSKVDDSENARVEKTAFKAQASYDGSFKSGYAYEVTIDANGLKEEKDFVEVLGEYGFEFHEKTGTDFTFAFSADNDVQNALQNASNTLKFRKVGELNVLPIDFSCSYVAKTISSGYALCLSTEQEMQVANQIILASGIEDISTSVGFGQGEDKYRIVTTDASKSENILKKVYTLLGKPQEVKRDALSGSTSESTAHKTKDGFVFEVSGRKLTFKADVNFNSIMDYVFGWFKTEFDTIDGKRQFVDKTNGDNLTQNFIGVLEKLSIKEAVSKKVAEQFDTIISKTHREYDLSTTMYERSIGAPEGQISDYREFKGEVVVNDNGTAFAVFTSNTGSFVKSVREQFGSADFEVNGNLNTLKVPLDGNFSIKEFDAGLVGKFLKAHDDNYGVLSKRFNPVKVIKPGRVTFQPSKNYASLSLKQDVACYLVGLEKYQQYSKVSSVVGFDDINTIEEFYSLCEVLDNYDFEGNYLKAFRCSKYISDARANGGELKIDKNGKELKVAIRDDMIIINLKGMKLPKINTPFWNEGDESALLKTYYMGHKKFNDALAVLDNFLDKELSEATTSEIAGADDISTVEQKFHLEHQKGGFKIVTTSPLATMLLLNDLQLDLTDNKDGSVYVKLSHFSKTVGTKKQVVNALTAAGYVEGEHVATPGSAASTSKTKLDTSDVKPSKQSIDVQIEDAIEANKGRAEEVLKESFKYNTSGHTVANYKFLRAVRPKDGYVLYVFELMVSPKFGSPVKQKVFVKGYIETDALIGYTGSGAERKPVIAPVRISIDRTVTSWVGYDYEPDVAERFEKTMSFDEPKPTSINWSTAETALKGQYFKDSNYKVVNMKVDELISRQANDFRIDAGSDTNRIKGRAERALAHITSGAPMDMPVVEIDTQGNLQVVDGRHRIAVAKEMGLKEIPVFLHDASKQAETPKAPVIPKQSGELEVVVSLYSSMDTDYINVKDGELSLQTGYTKRTDGFYRYAPKGMTYSDGEKYVKDEILRMYNSGASNNAIKAKFEEMIGQRGRVIDVRGERANSNTKDIKRPIATTLEKLKTVGDSKKLTGLDLSAGITKTYNGQTGTVGVVYYVAGNEAQIDEIYKEMRSSVVYTGFVGFFEVEFTEPYSKKKFKAKFTEQGVEIPSGMQTHIGNGRYVSVTQAGITKTVADSFSNGSPDAVVNDYMAYVGISNWMYTIKKTNLVKAIFLKYDINAIKSLKSVKVGMMNESIKEDLTGIAPKQNKVDKSLLEKSMRQLGMYQSSFAYGGSTFSVTLNEGVVDILPTSGNVAYLSKMLGVKLGQDLVQDERGGLRFDIA